MFCPLSLPWHCSFGGAWGEELLGLQEQQRAGVRALGGMCPILGVRAVPPFLLAPRRRENPLENSVVRLHNPRFALSLWHCLFDRVGTSLTLEIPQDPCKDEDESISLHFCLERFLLNPSVSSSALGEGRRAEFGDVWVFSRPLWVKLCRSWLLCWKTQGLCKEIAGKC